MLKRFFPKLNQKAFTLIEIVLAVALLAIVTVAIGSVIISTQNNTTRMFTEAELQQQLVEVQQAVHDEILVTNAGIKYWAKNGKNDDFVLTEKDTGTEYEKLVAFYSLDSTDYLLSKTYYLYNSKDRTLKMAELEEALSKSNQEGSFKYSVDDDIESTLASIPKWTLVAGNLEEFSIDVSTYGINKLVSSWLEVKQDNSSYPTDDTIYLRNDISINSDLTIDEYHVIELVKPTLENTKFIYNGQEHGPTELNYFERYMTRTGVLTATDAGTYIVTYSLKDKESTVWVSDNGQTSITDVTCVWTIDKKTVSLSWGTTSWIYDKSAHSTTCDIGLVESTDDCHVNLINNSVGPNVGEVECTAKLVGADSHNYQLPTNSGVKLKITANVPTVNITTIDSTYDNTGNAQTMVSYSNLVGGTLRFYISTDPTDPIDDAVNSTECKAVDAGTYYVWYRIIAANDNYSTTEAIRIDRPAVMHRSPTAVVSSSNKTYNGDEQVGIQWLYANITGSPSGVDAGNYTAYAVPDSNHLWTDGTDALKTLPWTINKANGLVMLSANSGTLTYPDTGEFIITENKSNGVLSVLSEDENIAKATLNDHTVTLTPGANGNQPVAITVTAAETKNYNAATATYTLNVNKGSLEIEALDYNGVYDAADHSISVSCKNVSEAIIMYSTDGSNYTTDNPAYKDVGIYTVYYKVVKAGYNDAIGNKKVVITKANGQLLLDATNGKLIYPASGSFKVTKNLSGGTLSVVSSNTNVATVKLVGTTVQITSGTTSGKAIITVTSAETKNYKAATATYEVTVESGNLNPTITPYEGIYDGAYHGIIVACSGSTIKYGTEAGAYDKTSSPKYKDAGTYTVYFQITKPGYNDYTGSATIKIKQATGTIALSRITEAVTYPSVGSFTISTNSDGVIDFSSSAPETATASATNPKNGTTVTVLPGTKSGTAIITVSVAESNNFSSCSATYTITVNSGNLSVTANSYNKMYDGKAHGISVSCKTSGVKIEYSTDNKTWSTTNPTWTNATSAQTVYYRVSKDGYKTVTGSQTVTITKAAGEINLSKAGGTITYPGTDTANITKNTSRGVVTVTSSDPSVATAVVDGTTVTIIAGTKAGTATITVTSAETDNYNSASTTYMATVQEGALTVTAHSYNEQYDGKAHGISVSCTESDVTIEYSVDNIEWSTTNPTWTNATSAQTVYYKVTKPGYGTMTGSATVTITKADGEITLSSTSGAVTYPDFKTISVKTNKSGGKISVESSNAAIAQATIQSDGSIKITACTTPGDATITVTSAATTNYNAASATYKVTVGKGTMNITLTPYSGEYDGDSHTITISGAPSGATITYCTTESGFYSNNVITRTDAGTTNVYVKVSAAGYEDYFGDSVIEISRQKTAFVDGHGTTIDYDGQSHTVITGSNVEWISGIRTATEPGVYTVTVKPAHNYAWSDGTTTEQTVSWTIQDVTFKVGDAVYALVNCRYYASAGHALNKNNSGGGQLKEGRLLYISFFHNGINKYDYSVHTQAEANTWVMAVDGRGYAGGGASYWTRLDQVEKRPTN
jgi:prepilin-type N-terminal cleavage/methylation domain-containing protein